ncbi:twitching motility protein PilT [Achromatium sp. WMS3]|nr:twitching motility protein PilT [Achromatium sp. WMS3]
MLVIDSSVWIDYFNGKETPQTLFIRDYALRDQILVGDLILCEVLQGFKQQEHFENAKELLLSFTYQNMVGNKIAVKSAENYRHLRSNGITIRKTIFLNK